MNALEKRVLKGTVGVLLITAAVYSCKIFIGAQYQIEDERHLRVVSDIRAMDCQLDRYKEHNGSYPVALSAIDNPAKDPWGQEYVYRFPGVPNHDEYDLFSAGPDRKPDTPDDDWGE